MHQRQVVPPLHDVDLRLLRVFKSVVECGGFSAAEENLGLSRSAISKHISELEARFSVRLCERGRSGFALSAHGNAVYRATNELLDALDQFRTQISIAKGTLTGTLSLCLMADLQYEEGNPISVALQAFARRSDDLALVLSTVGPTDAEAAVAARTVEMAITSANSQMSGLEYTKLGMHRSSLYASAELQKELGRNIDPSTINVVTPLYLERDHPMLHQKWLSTAGARDIDATIQLVLTGRYAGVLPDHIARTWVQGGRMSLLPIAEGSVETPTYLVYRKKSETIPTVRAMRDDILGAYSTISAGRRNAGAPEYELD